ncbi:hypothetical protein F5Y12DRAFT_797264 [Xylaria sp. FL1777]|nr:hypothetical protein F5Y12DRAFT_797264 [Xylaria sp. FL1777]
MPVLIPVVQDPDENPPQTLDVTMASYEEPKSENIPGSAGYECERCGRILSRQDALVRHIRIVHGSGRNFWCQQPRCVQAKKGFRRFYDYQRHMRHVHNIIITSNSLNSSTYVPGNQVRPGANEPQVTQQRGLEAEPQQEARSEGQYEPQNGPQNMYQHLGLHQNHQTSQFMPPYVPDPNYTAAPAFNLTDGYLVTTSATAPLTPEVPPVGVQPANSQLYASPQVAFLRAQAQQSLLLEHALSNPDNYGPSQFAELVSARMLGSLQLQQQFERFAAERDGLIAALLQSREPREPPNEPSNELPNEPPSEPGESAPPEEQ